MATSRAAPPTDSHNARSGPAADETPGGGPTGGEGSEVGRGGGPSADHAGQEAGSGRSLAEWVTLAVSSLLVMGLIGATTWLHWTASSDPPAMMVETQTAEAYGAGGRFYLPVTVWNTGGLTAEEVRVRIVLTDGAGRTETAGFQVQFLAGGGSERGVVSFGSDPRQGQIEAVVESFLEP